MCERISRPIESESRNEEKNMKKNVPIKKQPVAAKGQTPDIQRRINAGWLRLWRTVWPNIPPPKVQSPRSKVQSPTGGVQSLKSKVQGLEPAKSKVSRLGSKVPTLESSGPRPAAVSYLSRFLCAGFALAPVKVQSLKSKVQSRADRRPAAVERLASFLAVWFALALLATGCAGPRPLKGGKAITTRKPAGTVEQTLVQGENPSQASKQTQESVKVRTYTLPAGSRMEQSLNAECGVRIAEGRKAEAVIANAQPSTSFAASRQPSTLNAQPSTTFVLSAPMPVVEREETHAAAELGAAQKDTARELGAKLSSLKGIVWVGVGLFVFGLGSLVYPPLKVIIGSVTTSAALMLGGIALMVLPTLIVGNELLILGGVALTVGGWFLAHRHGQLRGMVGESLKSKV